MERYSEKLLDYFRHPRNAGELASPSAAAEASNPVCGDALKLSVVMESGTLMQVRFKAAGCVPTIACGSWLAEYLENKRFSSLSSLAPASIEEALGGLPAASHHAAVLAADVLQGLLRELAKTA
ncbi:MAG TPA: iron-sulfur cluster assembly scaffold protein [Terriglobia bacterium]|nr:iron-sulfur cluster assembly scaffold protein [Terriglobia bacterium]